MRASEQAGWRKAVPGLQRSRPDGSQHRRPVRKDPCGLPRACAGVAHAGRAADLAHEDGVAVPGGLQLLLGPTLVLLRGLCQLLVQPAQQL